MRKDVFGNDEDIVECYVLGTVVKIPANIFFPMAMGTEIAPRKFLRYKDGAELYGISPNLFKEIAREADAVYKVGVMALVNRQKFEEYLSYFYVDEDVV